MKTEWHNYVSTKTVRAAKMSAEEAQRAGANITDEVVIRNYGKEGYVIDYPDGYRSWCPAEAFAYKLADSYIDRMEIEYSELGERILKATSALYAGSVELTYDCRSDLRTQLDAMRIYSECLYHRITEVKDELAREQQTNLRKEDTI